MFCCASNDDQIIERRGRIAAASLKLPGPVEELESSLGKGFIQPHDEQQYTEARYYGKEGTESWMLNFVGFPSAICQCTTAHQVQMVVDYARKYCQPAGIPLAVACGRHSHQFMPDGAIVCDLSSMKSVKVMPEKMQATISAGCRGKEVHAACAPHDLGAVIGSHGTTGFMGFTLHGGHGILSTKMGLGADNILEVRIVTADGQLLTCTEDENAELFWAVCGCGSAFGIVIEMTIRLAKLPKGGMLPFALNVNVPLGSLGLPGRTHLITRFRDFFDRPENGEVSGFLILQGGGPVIEQCVWCDGAEDSLSQARAAWKEYNKTTGWFTLAQEMGEKCYHSEMNAPDDVPSVLWYLACELSGLNDEAIKVLDASVDSSVSPHCKDCSIIVMPADRLVTAKSPKDRNAYFHRDAKWHVIINAGAPTSLSGDAFKDKLTDVKQWAKDVRQKLQEIKPPLVLGAYNVAEDTSAADIYGRNLTRLKELKQKYDSQNLFMLNTGLLS
jgi:hypothetical protein